MAAARNGMGVDLVCDNVGWSVHAAELDCQQQGEQPHS